MSTGSQEPTIVTHIRKKLELVCAASNLGVSVISDALSREKGGRTSLKVFLREEKGRPVMVRQKIKTKSTPHSYSREIQSSL
jgi:hypothetical protein